MDFVFNPWGRQKRPCASCFAMTQSPVPSQKDEDFSGEWIIFELLAHDNTQAIKTLAQIAGLCAKADFGAVCVDHAWPLLRRTIPNPRERSAMGVDIPLTGELGSSTVSSTNSAG